jgi:hypothetical protein
MKSILRNAAAVLAGLLAGGALNMEIVVVSGRVIPFPQGVDATTTEGLIKGIHLMEPRHFIMPFLAHAMGTFLGSFVTALFATSHKMTYSIIVGCVFMIGGIMAVNMIAAPMWFNVLDLTMAYIPMALLAYYFAMNFGTKREK